MNKLTEELLELGLGNIIEHNIEQKLKEDEMYLADMKEVDRIKNKIDTFLLSPEQFGIIDDYIMCLTAAYARANDIAYMTGVKNTFLFLKMIQN